jgi:hypothetical protein
VRKAFAHIFETLFDHGAEFVAPIKSWANTYVGRPVLVVWLCNHPSVVRLILDRYDNAGLV